MEQSVGPWRACANPVRDASVAFHAHNIRMQVDGVILQATYRVRSGVPVIHLYGRAIDGRSFLVRDHRERPHFWVRSIDAGIARQIGQQRELSVEAHPDGFRCMRGNPLARVTVGIPADVPPLRDALHGRGIATFEADVRFATGYLLDRGIRGSVRIIGEPVGVAIGEQSTDTGRFGEPDLVFDDPDLVAIDVAAEPRVLSIDIETDPAARRLLAISLYGLGLDEVLIVDPAGRSMPERAYGFPSERALLGAFAERVQAADPDILTGWNVIEFDMAVLERVGARVGRPLRIGRDNGALRVQAAERPFRAAAANLTGRLVLDGIELMRSAFIRHESQSLDAVARAVLGEGKALVGPAVDRVDEILENYRADLPAFALYARTDARLALQILERLDLINLALARTRLTGMTPDRVSASIASFDFLYLGALHRRQIAAPSVASVPTEAGSQSGGQVLAPRPGLYRRVWVFDFKSLYPSIIRTFNIDPLGYVGVLEKGAHGLIVTPTGAAFRREPGILPGLLDELAPRRDQARAAGDRVASQAIKILMNSFYGVLGTPGCRFHNAAIANAITGLGRYLLEWARNWFQALGYTVLYGDTDSLFVASACEESVAADALGQRLVRDFNLALTDHVRSRWAVASRLELQFEKLYERLLLPSMRHGSEGARKRYVGLRAGGQPDALEFVGMEAVRRDWTDLARGVQRELYRRLFAGEPVDVWLKATVRAVRAGEHDEALVYRKALRKPLAHYQSTSPPHVVAARKRPTATGRVIAYVITTAGPEPVDALTAPPDREHYVDRQIRPVAEPVLHTLGLDFAAVIGDDQQLDLF